MSCVLMWVRPGRCAARVSTAIPGAVSWMLREAVVAVDESGEAVGEGELGGLGALDGVLPVVGLA